MKKRNISLILAIAICIMQLVIPITTVYAVTNPSVTAANVYGAPGEEIQVDFTLSDNPGLTALLVKVEYDSNFLELIDIKDYGFFGRVFTKPTITNNPINLNWVDGIDNYSENGKLATMIFKIKESAAEGQTSLTLTTKAGETYNYDKDNDDYTDYDLNLSGGTITIKKSENTDTVVKPAIQNTTPDGFVIKAQTGYEYCISESNSISDGAVWTTNTTVTGKTPNTTYYVFGRIAATNTVEASAPSASTLVRVPNNDTSLKSLSVASGTLSPAFAAGTYSYTVTIPYGGNISQPSVELNDRNASYEFTKTASDFGTNNTTEITVTAENGEDTKLYTITYSEINAVLSTLTVNGASVTGFNPDTTAYTYNVSYADWNSNKTQTYTIVATPSKNTSTVSISKNNFALTSTDSDNDSTEDVTVIVTAEGGEKTTYTITFTVLACPHTNKTITDSAAADCTNDGFEEYTCPDCGKTDRKTLTALGHDWSTEWAIDIPANCTTDGSKSHHCTRTGCDTKNDVTVINALGHSWSFWTKVGDTDNYTRTCSRDNCGANETKTATEIDHTHVFDGATESITAATCTTKGLQKRYCSVESCPEYIEEDVDKIAHTPCAPEVTNSTCTTEGSSIIKCSVCGETISTTILDKAEHNYGEWESDANGHWKSCIVCLVPSEKAAHSENNGIVTTPATSSTSGIKTYSCNDCGRELRTEVIPATGDVVQPTYPPSSTPSAPSTSSGTTVSTSEPMLENGSGQGGWSSIEKYVANAESGSTVYVDMNGTTLLPKNILNKLSGRNVNLVLKMNDNITWTINGKSVEKANDINMNVKLNTNNIPTNVISSVSDGNDVIQLSLSHDGSFGFNAVMTIALGTQYNGKFANLMYYNPKNKELEFVDASTVANGKATLNFSHASDYAIVIGNTPMTAYEDVSSGAASNYDETEISSGNSMTYFISIILLIGTAFITVFIFKKRVKK